MAKTLDCRGTILGSNGTGCQMHSTTTEAVTLLAASAGVDLAGEADAVAERLAQLMLFARELDGLVADEVEIDAVFDAAWDQRS